MARYHAKEGQVYMSVNSTDAASPVSSMSAWSLSLARDRVEVTAFGDTNKQFVQGLPDISGTFSGFWDDTESDIVTGSESANGVKLYLYPDAANAETKYHYGPAWVDISDISADNSGAVTISASFVSNGAWGDN
jgi:hypothetical protein